MRNWLGRAAIDVTALRASAPFRRLFAAHMASGIGSQVTLVTIQYQVYILTHSTLAVGFVGLAQVVPTVLFALVGGAIADATDRKRVLVGVQVVLCACSTVLALMSAFEHPSVGVIYLLAALSAGFASIDNATRTAALPMTVTDETMRSAVQLRESLTQTSRLVGPLLGGMLLHFVGIAAAYGVDAATFVWAMLLYAGMPSLRPLTRRHFDLGSIVEGVRFAVRKPVLGSTFIADLIAMVLGMPRAVFPALALSVYHVGTLGLGFLNAAPAAGAIIGVAFGGLTAWIKREGLAVLGAVAAWGIAIAAFGIAPWFALALLLLAFAGFADTFSAIWRQTILLATTPDELRGRVSSVHVMVVTGGPPLGDFEAGAMASLIGLRTSIVAGGAACIAGIAVLGLCIPQFARWVDPTRAPNPPLPSPVETAT